MKISDIEINGCYFIDPQNNLGQKDNEYDIIIVQALDKNKINSTVTVKDIAKKSSPFKIHSSLLYKFDPKIFVKRFPKEAFQISVEETRLFTKAISMIEDKEVKIELLNLQHKLIFYASMDLMATSGKGAVTVLNDLKEKLKNLNNTDSDNEEYDV